MRKVIIEIETEQPWGIESYLREVLSMMAKNRFFSIRKFDIKVIKEQCEGGGKTTSFS